MRQKKLNIMGMVLVLVLIFFRFEQVDARQKEVEKPLKQEWAKKTREFSYETVAIEKGKSYTLKEVIKPFSSFTSIIYDFNKKLNKGSKITISGKGLMIKKKTISGKKSLVKKNTIRADDVGDYWLRVNLNDSVHLFRVKAVETDFKVMESEVDKVAISEYRMGEVVRIEITDPLQIRQIVSKLMKPRYVFETPRVGTLKSFGKYSLALYSADGKCITWQEMIATGMADGRCIRHAEDPVSARECYDYIYQLFKDMLAQIPKRSWE